MCNYTVEQDLVCDLDYMEMENLTKEEFRAASVVSLFGRGEANFQICVDEQNFDSNKVVDALRNGCIEDTCFNVSLVDPRDLILVSNYSKSEIEKNGKKIRNVFAISNEDYPGEHITMLELQDRQADGRIMLLAQHVVER